MYMQRSGGYSHIYDQGDMENPQKTPMTSSCDLNQQPTVFQSKCFINVLAPEGGRPLGDAIPVLCT